MANNLQWNIRVLICTLETTFWIDKIALWNKLREICFTWQICESIYKILLQPRNLQLPKVWQKHVEKFYPCIVNGTELFSRILRIKICHVNKTIATNLIISWTFVKIAILSYTRHKQGINLLKSIIFWNYCPMIIHNSLI